jgi:hypothetical protein
MYTNKGLKNNFTGLNQSNSIYEFNITKPNSISDIVYFSPYKTEVVQTNKTYRFEAESSNEYWVRFIVTASAITTSKSDGDILWGFYPDKISNGIYIAREDNTNRFYLYNTDDSKLFEDYFEIDFAYTKDNKFVLPYNDITIHIISDSTNGKVSIYKGIKKVLQYDGNILNGKSINCISFGGCGISSATPENSLAYSGIIISTYDDSILNTKISYTDPNLKETFDTSITKVIENGITNYQMDLSGQGFDISLSSATIDTNNEATNGINSLVIPIYANYISAKSSINGLNIYVMKTSGGSKTLVDSIEFSDDGDYYKDIRLYKNPITDKPFTASDFSTTKIRVEAAKII